MYAKLFSTAAVLALLASPAYAGSLVDLSNSNAQAQSQGQNQSQGQKQGQAQGQHQNSTNINVNANKSSSHSAAGAVSGAAAFNKGNSFASTTNVDASTDVDAEPAYAPNVNLTSSGCIGSIGGSGGGLGLFSVGFATTMESQDCFKLEAAKIYLSMGDKSKALAVMESVDYIGAAVGQKTATIKISELPSIPPATASIQEQAVAMKLTASNVNPATGKYDLACELGWMDCSN